MSCSCEARASRIRSSPPGGAWRSSPVAPNSARPRGVIATPAKSRGTLARSSTSQASASSRSATSARSAGGCTWSRIRSAPARRRRHRSRRAGVADDDRAAAVAQPVEQRLALAEAGHDARPQPRPERGRHRELEARIDLELRRERARVVRRRRRAAQEVVDGGELGARLRRRGARADSARRSASRWAARASSTACSAWTTALRGAAPARPRRRRAGARPRPAPARARRAPPRAGCRARSRASRSSASSAAMRSSAPVSGLALGARLDLGGVALVARGVVGGGPGGLARALGPQRDAVGRGASGEQAAREPLARARVLGERLLGGLAALRDLGEQALGLVALAARAAAAARSASARSARAARRSSAASSRPASSDWRSSRWCSSAASAWRFSGRSRERASRSTSSERARLSSRALELELCAPAPLAVLAEPGRLLDQEPPVARLRVDDRLDAALRDDRVHLLAEAGVREHLDHVHEPAAGAVQAVLALAVAGELAHDRDLREVGVEPAVGVVEQHLDLGGVARRHAGGPGEDDVLHRLAANGERALLAERPQDGVRDVRLARAVRADDDRDARREVELRAVGERLEALQRDRAQVHQSDLLLERSSARSAAACSAAFLVFPLAAPELLAVHHGDRDEAAVVRRALLALDQVLDDLGAAREPLLQLRLEVHRVLERVLDLALERLDHRGRDAVPAEGQVGGADHGLADRREDAVARDRAASAVCAGLRRRVLAAAARARRCRAPRSRTPRARRSGRAASSAAPRRSARSAGRCGWRPRGSGRRPPGTRAARTTRRARRSTRNA